MMKQVFISSDHRAPSALVPRKIETFYQSILTLSFPGSFGQTAFCRLLATRAPAAPVDQAAVKLDWLQRVGGKALADLADKLPPTLDGVLSTHSLKLKQAGLTVKQRKAVLRRAEQFKQTF